RVGRQRPDRDVGTRIADVRQIGEPADVDELRRAGQPQLHRGDERVATGEQLRIAVGLERSEGSLDALRDLVVERCRNHAFASSIARQTRSGVAGIWTSVTPRCETASTTALITAGADAIVPVSPTPLTPSGFVGLTVVECSSSNDGSSAADGTR